MIKELKLENLAIIKNIELELDSPFISLTGETGAGKSIILDGISLLLGERGSTTSIRKGEDKLYAEAILDISNDQIQKLNELGYDLSENEIIISRTYDKNSNSKINIDGKRFKVSSLKEIMSNIVDLVGQHDHQYLLNSDYHLELFDKFLDEEGKKKKEKLSILLNEYRINNKKLLDLDKKIQENIEKRDLYEFQINEFEKIMPYEKEDEELENKYSNMLSAGKILENLENISYILTEDDNNVLNMLKIVRKNLEELENIDSKYSIFTENISNIEELLSDISNDIVYNISTVETDDIDEIVKRINKIENLKKKYGPTLDDVFKNYEIAKKNIDSIIIDKDVINKLKLIKNNIIEDYKKTSIELSKIRKKIAKTLEDKINSEFNDLNMKNANFKINFTINNLINKNGIDNIEFLIKTNIGEDFKPLSKTASGGEISRIMLALKIVFSSVDNISILIFDEIDTGISGETVTIVAKKLKELSKKVQIICVTHSPQIAAYSDLQFFIEKKVVDNKTHTTVRKLNDDERIKELSRIISGSKENIKSLEYAKELLEEGKNYGK